MFRTTVIGKAYKVYGTAASLQRLFELDTAVKPTILMGYVAGDMIQDTTILREICQRGCVQPEEMFIAQASYGNFMQRLPRINDIYAGAGLIYVAEHQIAVECYSFFAANEEVLGLIDALPLREAPPVTDGQKEEIVQALQASLAAVGHLVDVRDESWEALYDEEASVSMSLPVSTFTLNYDDQMVSDMEKSGAVASILTETFFSGYIGGLVNTGMQHEFDKGKSDIYLRLSHMNSVAAAALNTDIAVYNALKRRIDIKAVFLNELLDNADNPDYLPFYAALAVLPEEERESLLSFSGLLNELQYLGYELSLKLDAIEGLYRSVLSDTPENQAYLSNFEDMQWDITISLNGNALVHYLDRRSSYEALLSPDDGVYTRIAQLQSDIAALNQ